jgi:TRAP-type mannitol/chloroaromatic compound transport system permease small subunit
MKDILFWFILLMPFNFIVIMCLIGVIMNRFKKIKLSDDLHQSIKLNKKGK